MTTVTHSNTEASNTVTGLDLGEDFNLDDLLQEAAAKDDSIDSILDSLTADTITVPDTAAHKPAAETKPVAKKPAKNAAPKTTAKKTAVKAADTTEKTADTSASVEPDNAAEPRAEAKKRLPITATTAEKVTNRLGEFATEYLILETKDAELPPEKFAQYQQDLVQSFNATSQIKVREKIVQLFGFMSGANKLNEVTRRAFTVLLKDGSLISGDKGNLHENLLAKPYSVGTARAQSGQMFSMFQQLKIVNKSDRGVYDANPDSVILQVMKQKLGL